MRWLLLKDLQILRRSPFLVGLLVIYPVAISLLVGAAVSGNPKFFLGTDSAPHARAAKEAACGCAGIYTAHAAIELYAIAFEEAGALDKLEGFASEFGARFYGLPVNGERITLLREDWKVPERLAFGGDELVPLRAGESIPWKLA